MATVYFEQIQLAISVVQNEIFITWKTFKNTPIKTVFMI